jgi:hypothetical protein
LLGLLVIGVGTAPGRAEWRRSYNTSCDCNGTGFVPQPYYAPTPAPNTLTYVPPGTSNYTPPTSTFTPAPAYTPTYQPPAAMPNAPTPAPPPPPQTTSNYTPPVTTEIAVAPPDGSVPIYNPTPVKPGPPLTMPAPTDSTVFSSPGCCQGGCCSACETCCPVCECTCHPGLIARIKANCEARKASRTCCSSPCDSCCCTAEKHHPILDKIHAWHEAKKCGDPCGEKKHLFKCFHKKDSCEPVCCPGQ